MPDFVTPEEGGLARLFDALGIEWEYEPREFVLETHKDGKTKTAFRPDFYLPQLDLYIEVTMQSKMTRKNRKVRMLTELHPEVNIALLGRKELAIFAAA